MNRSRASATCRHFNAVNAENPAGLHFKIHPPWTEIEAKGVRGVQLLSDPTAIYREWFGSQGKERKDPKIKGQYTVIISPWHKSDAVSKEKAGTQLTLVDDRDFFMP